MSAVLLATALPNPPVRDEWRAEMERLSERSRERYRGLVYDDPEFLRFFGQVAPIAELSQLNLGSRPPSRKGNAGRRVAARDPVGLRLDAEPPAAAVLVRRRERRWRPATSSCSARCGATGRSSAA